jgi:tRNA uridine 5-carboxymethylaminomethyl modification enzyme
VEYRLLLREDNADARLTPIGHRLGLIDDARYREVTAKRRRVAEETERLRTARLKPDTALNARVVSWGSSPLSEPVTLAEFLRRPEIGYENIVELSPPQARLNRSEAEQVEIEVKYAGYIERQEKQIERFRQLESLRIPETLDFARVYGLSCEAREKLSELKPVSLGQASRISGITPASVTALWIHLKKRDG